MKALLITLFLILLPCYSSPPTAVATFNNISIYWRTTENSKTSVKVEYKKAGKSTWNRAQDLWWAGNEYRGSILDLDSNSDYTLKLSSDQEVAHINKQTWNEIFRIKRTVSVNDSPKNYSISSGGDEATGYVLYDFSDATIDANFQSPQVLNIDADYVIVRGGTFINANTHAILIGENRHHVTIEGAAIENWGSRPKGYQTSDRHAAIGLRQGCSQIIVQGCHIRQPRFDAWDWSDGEGAPAGENHPHGAFGIGCPDEPSNLSNNVFRHNHFQASTEKRLEDGMGAFSGNFSDQGFPGADSDIYGNHVENCVDNGIEAEGGGQNIRVYENYLDRIYTPMGTKTVTLGPAYFVRNIAYRSVPVKGRSMKFFKAGGTGRRYFFHNMTLSDDAANFNRGIDDDTQGDLISRNNIFIICESGIGSESFSIGAGERADFDYDLYNGNISIGSATKESHGIHGHPVFRKGHGPGKSGRFQLSKSSPGYDQGTIVHNVNDDYQGNAPDMGAHEFGKPDLLFGLERWKSESK